jgi:hypothetical protein
MQATINLEITICASRWASALPVGERKRRLVAVLWAALGQPQLASACTHIGAEIKAQWRVENLFRD